MTLQPILLPPNQPADRFYQGGARIARLRGEEFTGGNVPEDWVASTTCLFGESNLGLTRLASGEYLRDAVAAHPVAWLGEEHVQRWGSDTMLLTKLLDAGQRLPVHLHPDDEFAARHLGRAHGKTEAWLVLRPGVVHLGFRREVSPEELARMVAEQDTVALLDALHALEVEPGDGVLVPAGLPHAIGAGIFLVEVQQPEDLSILLEWKGFTLAPDAPRDLGLGMDLALQATDLKAYPRDEVAALVAHQPSGPALPQRAGSFFRADWVGPTRLEPGLAVLVVLEGSGHLEWEDGSLPLQRGAVVLVPHQVGATRITGEVRAALCRPPAPAQ